MGLSFGHLIVILVIVLVIFGAGKLPQIMADMAKGMRAFKDGMKDETPQKAIKSEAVNTKPAVKEVPKKAPAIETKPAAKTSSAKKPAAKTETKPVAKKAPAKKPAVAKAKKSK